MSLNSGAFDYGMNFDTNHVLNLAKYPMKWFKL